MENFLGCQVCLTDFCRVSVLKNHLRSQQHKQKMREIFNKNCFKFPEVLPHIHVTDQSNQRVRPYIGTSLLTLCFCPDILGAFYLCHVCEEKVSLDRIISHLNSGAHISNYFNHSDPNVLPFSWVPTMDMRVVLMEAVKRKAAESGLGRLQVLDLPEKLLVKFESSSYSEVMLTLGENAKLLKLFEAVRPKRVTIQTYQRDSQRKHLLLGVEQLIECVCVGPPERRYYLCTLCKLTLAAHMIIKHVLSFDHLHCYFKKWHPTGLMAKEVYYYHISSLASMMLDFAKKTEKIHGKPSAEMKQVKLEPDKFRSVNFNCYAQALKELDPMIMEGSLVTAAKPGNQLECDVASPSEEFNYKIRCQDCSMIFMNDLKYFSHVKTPKHKMTMEKLFKRVTGEKTSDDCVQKAAGWKPQLGLYQFIINSLKQNTAAIGVALVVMCVSTDAQTNHFYLCFACEECFPESRLREHFSSRKHLIHTLLYQNPWRLPFAWEKHLDVTVMRSMALEEEKERGPGQMVLKVFDIPYRKSINFQQSFPDVMTALQLHHTTLKREVPRCETLSKLQDNERFPLLGERFLVKHETCTSIRESADAALLCLLCKRRLAKAEWTAHVFSREHVESFLQKLHPGSVNSNTVAEILDMAKQAARIHPKSHVQIVNLERPIWEPCSYEKATNILAFAKKREGKGKLEPTVVPQTKLVPRIAVKKEEKGNVTDTSLETSQTTQGWQKQTGADSKKTPLIQIPADAGATVAHVKTENNVDNRENKQRPGQNVQSSGESRDASPKSIPDVVQKAEGQTPPEIKIVECWTLQAVKEEPMETPLVSRPVAETSESCRSTGRATAPKVKEEASKNSCAVLKEPQDGGCSKNKRKRPSGMSDQSQDGTVPGVDEEKEMERKKFCCPSKTQSEDPPDLCPNKQKEARPVGSLSEFPAEDEGCGAIYKFQCAHSEPIYFCARCSSLSIPERDIISHVAGSDHQEMSLTVLDLPEELYHRIAHRNFNEAVREVMVYQSSGCGPNSVTSLPAARHGGPSVPPNTQQLVHSFTDDLQVIDMDVDLSEDMGAQPSSETAAVAVTSAATSGTTELPPPSSKDLKKITAESGNAGTTVSKSAAPSRATKTSCLHPVSKEHSVKADINSSTTVERLKTKNIQHIAEKSENAAASHSALTSTAKAAAFKGPARPLDSTPVTVSSAAPDPSRARPAPTAARLKEASAASTKQAAPSRDPQTLFKAASQLSVGKNGGDAKASANTGEKRVQPNTQVTTRARPTAAPRPGQPTVVRSADKDLPKGPSDSCRNKEKPRYNTPEVGVDQLISVKCRTKRQVYCQLCSCRISQSRHVFTFQHKFNWAKMFVKTIEDIPPSESKLDKIVIQLVGVEKELGLRNNQCQKIKVDIVQYDELYTMPVEKALERLKEMLRQRDSSTSDRAQASELQPGFTSPSEVSSPDHEQDSTPGEERSQSDGGQGFRSSEVDHLHPDPLLKKPELIAAPGMKEAQKAVVRTEINQGCADPLSTDSKPAGTFQNGTIQNASWPQLGREPSSQNQPGPSHVEKHEPNRSVYTPRPPSQASQALASISRGERLRGRSNLSVSLDVSGYKPVIGLGSMWECRGVSLSQLSTFFLCESCAEAISNHNICKHMSSSQHQLNYIMRQYPKYMRFWDSQDITEDQKIDILKGVANILSGEEINEDARVVLLREDMHDYVQKAPFSEALKMLQNIDAEPKQSVSGTLGRDESREKAETFVLQQTVICSNVKESLDSDACHSPREACDSLSEQPEVKPSISPSQPRPEVPSERPSSSGSPTTSQILSLSPKKEFLPCRKRPAEAPLETLIKSEPDNSEPDGVKSKSDSVSPESDFSSTHPSPKDQKEGITPDKHNKALKNLAALIRQMKSKVNVAAPMLGPPHSGTPCTGDSSQGDVEKKSKQVQTASLKVIKTERCQTDLPYVTAMVKQVEAEADSSKTSPMAPPGSCENQQLGPNASVTEAVVASGDPQENIQTRSPAGNLSPVTSGNVTQTPGDSPGGQQLYIDAIITPRTSATKQQFRGSYNKYHGNRGNQFGQVYSETALNSSGALAASGQYDQMSSVANEGILSYHSAGAVAGHTTPGDPAEYNQGLYSASVFGQSHVHPEQQSSGFLQSAASTGHMSQEMQQWLVQQQQLLQQQHFLQQQQLLQQQQQQQFIQQLHVTSWTSATLPAAGVTGSSEAAAGAFISQANGSQIFGNLNQPSAVGLTPTQMSDNTTAQNFHRVYPSSFFTHGFPTANGAFFPQAPVNSFFAPDKGFSNASPAAQVQHDTMH